MHVPIKHQRCWAQVDKAVCTLLANDGEANTSPLEATIYVVSTHMWIKNSIMNEWHMYHVCRWVRHQHTQLHTHIHKHTSCATLLGLVLPNMTWWSPGLGINVLIIMNEWKNVHDPYPWNPIKSTIHSSLCIFPALCCCFCTDVLFLQDIQSLAPA